MEACGGANYWARELVELGHEVKLIAPQYVRPFVKRQKNDAADAEAIVIAAQRPEMRFVKPKSEWQQAKAVLFRARERLVYQRTELVNCVRYFTNTVIQSRRALSISDGSRRFSTSQIATCPPWSTRNAAVFWRKSARRQFESKPKPRRSRKWRPKRI